METENGSALIHRNRAPRKLRAVGILCTVAALGGLATGCGSDDSDAAKKTSKAAEAAAAAAQTESPSGYASPTQSASPSASASPGDSASPSPANTLTDDQAERKALVPQVKVQYAKALTAAVAAVPDSKPVAIELQSDQSGKPWWDADVAKADGSRYNVRVDAVSGKADKAKAETDEDAEDKQQLAALLGKAKITPEDAAAVATGESEGTVSSVELDDTDQGAAIWAVDVISPKDFSKTSYEIDATTKKVLNQEVDRD